MNWLTLIIILSVVLVFVVMGTEVRSDRVTDSQGCFEIVMNSEYRGNGRLHSARSGGGGGGGRWELDTTTIALLLDTCSGRTWQLHRESGKSARTAWFPVTRH